MDLIQDSSDPTEAEIGIVVIMIVVMVRRWCDWGVARCESLSGGGGGTGIVQVLLGKGTIDTIRVRFHSNKSIARRFALLDSPKPSGKIGGDDV
jgi:hypothetical protein